MHQNQNQPIMQDKDLLEDALSSQKFITDVYNTYTNECVTQEVRNDMMKILQEEHDIQAQVFDEMQSRGWYQVQPAEQQKIDQTKQKFQNMTM